MPPITLFKVVVPVTPNVPAIIVLPVLLATVNLLVLMAKSPRKLSPPVPVKSVSVCPTLEII